MNIKILGSGCPKCKTLLKHTEEAVAEAGIDANIEKVEDINDIMKYGVMITPALVADGTVIASGKTLSKNEIIELLTKK